MCLRVAFFLLVLGRGRNFNKRGINYCAALQNQTALHQQIHNLRKQFLMKHILEDLYHGNLTVSGQTFQRGMKYAHALKRVTKMENTLGQKLTPEDHPLLAEYAMASAGLISVSIEEAYIEGFRTGAQIVLAVLEANEAPESEDEKA